MNGVRDLSALTPEMAMQHALLYPATADQPASIFTTAIVAMKGRDIYGFLTTQPGATPATGSAPPAGASQQKTIGIRPVPTSREAFTSTGAVSADVIARLRKLGIPVGP